MTITLDEEIQLKLCEDFIKDCCEIRHNINPKFTLDYIKKCIERKYKVSRGKWEEINIDVEILKPVLILMGCKEKNGCYNLNFKRKFKDFYNFIVGYD